MLSSFAQLFIAVKINKMCRESDCTKERIGGWKSLHTHGIRDVIYQIKSNLIAFWTKPLILNVYYWINNIDIE